MEQTIDSDSRESHHLEDDYESQIAALDRAPTGAPLGTQDYIFLFVTGIVIPVALLVWGWA